MRRVCVCVCVCVTQVALRKHLRDLDTIIQPDSLDELYEKVADSTGMGTKRALQRSPVILE